MPAIFFTDLDALRLALASGAVPPAVGRAPARAGFDAQGRLWRNAPSDGRGRFHAARPALGTGSGRKPALLLALTRVRPRAGVAAGLCPPGAARVGRGRLPPPARRPDRAAGRTSRPAHRPA